MAEMHGIETTPLRSILSLQTFFESGMTGLQNVATDGLSMIAQVDQRMTGGG